MDKIARASAKERAKVFLQAGHVLNMHPFVVEKDFWVSWVLHKIFSDATLSTSLCFKGGTSLSKGFGLIERFSEDIDLILAKECILPKDEPLEQKSKSKQIKFNDELNQKARDYINGSLKDALRSALQPICSVESDEHDGHVLLVHFPRSYKHAYIRHEIKLEIGPLALWNPQEKTRLHSFVATAFPELQLHEPYVPTIKPERTFWEKITILHLEHYRPETSTIPTRYSRHYYDVYKIAQSNIKQIALAQLPLLDEVAQFKKQFYARSWARYDEARAGSIRLLPAPHSDEILRKDYMNMKQMIFGDYPQWDNILQLIEKLENEINCLVNL